MAKRYVLSTMIKQARKAIHEKVLMTFSIKSHCRICHSFFNLMCNILLINIHRERYSKDLNWHNEDQDVQSNVSNCLSYYLKELLLRRPRWITSQVFPNFLPNQALPQPTKAENKGSIAFARLSVHQPGRTKQICSY